MKLYDVLIQNIDAPAPWMREFPVVYLLAALGCMVVWSVDLLTMGDSAKMMAVATAARPDRTSGQAHLHCIPHEPRSATTDVLACIALYDGMANLRLQMRQASAACRSQQ